MRGGVATNKERLLPRRQDGEAAGKCSRWVFFSSLLKTEVALADMLILEEVLAGAA